ncbi:MAG: RNA-guided endonuclease TnpB family protein [Clostridiales bacterium]|nr:RNA-guided endonuclease TnpB family protein [Clostridiales bacterium]
MPTYSTIQFYIHSGNELYSYCDEVTHAANNLRNAALFRCRQAVTLASKPLDKLTQNEREVFCECYRAWLNDPESCFVPRKGKTQLKYTELECIMRINQNPDFFDARLSKQTAQHVLRSVATDMDSYFEGLKSYYRDSSKFTGRPQLPKYKKSGGSCTVKLTNQDCKIKINKDGTKSLKFPLTRTRFPLGNSPVGERELREVTIQPYHDIYILSLSLISYQPEHPPVSEKPKRICSIDLGVNNFAAITNNIGQPCLLFKGGAIKSRNQRYNRQMSLLKSDQTKGTPGESQKFVPTPESKRLCIDRKSWIDDYMHKCAKAIILWCIDNSIDTIIIGENTHWKQSSNMKKSDNQNFVSIPYDNFKKMLSYLCDRYGIRFIKQEESYTSKASFPDNDDIPVYGKVDTKPAFSGKRAPQRYTDSFGEHYRKNGFRGWYISSNGSRINSDLNGAANIGRKCIPDMFTMEGAQMPDFNSAAVYKHPDEYLGRCEDNTAEENSGSSNSKLKRLFSKRRLSKQQYIQQREDNRQLNAAQK